MFSRHKTSRPEPAVYQLFINFLSTFYQLFINFLSTFYQLFINFLSTFLSTSINFLSTFYQLSAFYKSPPPCAFFDSRVIHIPSIVSTCGAGCQAETLASESCVALKKKFKISGVRLAVIAVQYRLLTVFQGRREDSFCDLHI